MLRGVARISAALFAAGLLAGCGGSNPVVSHIALGLQDDYLALRDTPPGPRLALLAGTHTRITRVDAFWSDIAPAPPTSPSDPSDPAYRFDHLDIVMAGLAARGITPIVSVYNAPAWATGGRTDSDQVGAINSLAPDPQAFGQFMAALGRRYSGSFVPPGASRPLPRVRYWEIWNEPNLSLFLSPQLDVGGRRVSARAYAQLVRASYPGLKRVSPLATVIVGAGGPRSSTSSSAVAADTWQEDLQRLDVPLDAYSQHVYPASAPTISTSVSPSWSTIPDLLKRLEGWRRGLPLFITEAGYTTSETPFRKTHVTEDQQAEYLTQIAALRQLDTPRIRAVIWFNLQDNQNWPGGLLRADGSRKPSYDAFTRLVAASPRTLPR